MTASGVCPNAVQHTGKDKTRVSIRITVTRFQTTAPSLSHDVRERSLANHTIRIQKLNRKLNCTILGWSTVPELPPHWPDGMIRPKVGEYGFVSGAENTCRLNAFNSSALNCSLADSLKCSGMFLITLKSSL